MAKKTKKKTERAPDRVQPGFSAIDFKLPTRRSNLSLITFGGCYPPEAGQQVWNTKSEMTVIIMSGKVALYVEGKRIILTRGKVVLVPRQLKYHWVTVTKKVTFYVFSTPPWSRSQQRQVR